MNYNDNELRALLAKMLPDTEKDIHALSDLLQDCLVLFTEIAQQDDSGQYEISQRLRKQLDELCTQIKSES